MRGGGDENGLTTDHTFTGQKVDGTGLLYYNARYYDPQIGQFISPDSIVPDPTVLFDYNRYMYVRGNPLKFSDPSGHCTITPDVGGEFSGVCGGGGGSGNISGGGRGASGRISSGSEKSNSGSRVGSTSGSSPPTNVARSRSGMPAPRTTSNHNGYTYTTDSLGRPIEVKGQLQLKKAPRDGSLQKKVGKQGDPNDEGGHLIGSRFNGSSERINLVPQNRNFNRGAWKRLENLWARALKKGERVTVKIEPIYPSGSNSVRPAKFQVEYQIGNQPIKRTFFDNMPGGGIAPY